MCVLRCPFLLINIVVFGFRFTAIPLITTNVCHLSKSFVIISFGVPFPFSANQL